MNNGTIVLATNELRHHYAGSYWTWVHKWVSGPKRPPENTLNYYSYTSGDWFHWDIVEYELEEEKRQAAKELQDKYAKLKRGPWYKRWFKNG